MKSSGNNTTGSSSKTSAPMLISSLKQLAPVRKLAGRAQVAEAVLPLAGVADAVLLTGSSIIGDAAAVGRLAGEKVAQVLRGARPAAVPIEALKTSDVIVNIKTATAIGLEVPAWFRKSATRVVE